MKATRNNTMKVVIGRMMDRMLQGSIESPSFEVISICGLGSNGATLLVREPAGPTVLVLKILNLSYLIAKMFSLDLSSIHQSAYCRLDEIFHRLDEASVRTRIVDGLMPEQFNSAGEEMSFMREYLALKSISRDEPRMPHMIGRGLVLVDIHEGDSCRSFELPYVTMPHFKGIILNDFAIPDYVGNVSFSLSVAHQLTEIIASLRSYGIIHRDIYPNNLLFDEMTGLLSLIDMGSSITNENFSLDVPGERRGARRFMSPEQFRNPSSCSYASDCYFIGSVMFYLLSGTTPFDRNRTSSSIHRNLSESWPEATDLYPDVMELVCSIMAEDMETRPSLEAIQIKILDLILKYGR